MVDKRASFLFSESLKQELEKISRYDPDADYLIIAVKQLLWRNWRLSDGSSESLTEKHVLRDSGKNTDDEMSGNAVTATRDNTHQCMMRYETKGSTLD